MVLRAAYQDARASEWIAERAKIPAVMLPFTVGGTDGAKDLFGLFDDTLERLLAAIKRRALKRMRGARTHDAVDAIDFRTDRAGVPRRPAGAGDARAAGRAGAARGIVFIDLAIAQIAALGVIVAGMLDADPRRLARAGRGRRRGAASARCC